VSDDVATLSGHPPTRLAEFLRNNPDSYQRLAAAGPGG
jgi:hypothetical protein